MLFKRVLKSPSGIAHIQIDFPDGSLVFHMLCLAGQDAQVKQFLGVKSKEYLTSVVYTH